MKILKKTYFLHYTARNEGKDVYIGYLTADCWLWSDPCIVLKEMLNHASKVVDKHCVSEFQCLLPKSFNRI